MSSQAVLSLATSAAAEAPPPRRKVLTTAYLDFWLVGGATIVLWVVMFVGERLRGVSTIGLHLGQSVAFFTTLTLVVNFPHIISSYRIGYTKGLGFVGRHWPQMLLAPALLVGVCALGFFTFRTPPSAPLIAAFTKLNEGFAALGLATRLGRSPTLGLEVMGLLYHFMALTVGWHFVKQAYGCAIVYAKLDAYALTKRQLDILRWAMLALWIHAFIGGEIGSDARQFFGMPYYPLNLPRVWRSITLVPVLAGVLAVLYFVVWQNWRSVRKLPSLNSAAPYVAIYLWWFPLFYQPEYSVYVTQFGHSLQYLAFVYKFERGKLEDRRPKNPELRATAMVFGIVACGWIFFELLPNLADVSNDSHTTMMGCLFFLMCANLLLNVHHYFIDNVIWKFTNRDVREYLLR